MGVSTIRPGGGGDYTTLTAWATAKAGNAGPEDAQCFAGNCGALSVTAWLPSSSVISVDPSALHGGIDNGGTGFAVATDINIQDGVNWTIQDLYISTRLRIAVTDGAANSGTYTFLVQRNLISGTSANSPLALAVAPLNDPSPFNGNISYTARNNVVIVQSTGTPPSIMGGTFTGVAGSGTLIGVSVEVDNNTFYTATTTARGLFFNLSAPDSTVDVGFNIVNNAVFGPTTTCLSFPTGNGIGGALVSAWSVTYDATSDATADDWFGAGAQINQSSASWFVSTPTNLQLKAGSPGIDTGTSLGTFNDDNIMVTRPKGSAWDIGAFEFVASGGGPGAAKLIAWGSILG